MGKVGCGCWMTTTLCTIYIYNHTHTKTQIFHSVQLDFSTLTVWYKNRSYHDRVCNIYTTNDCTIQRNLVFSSTTPGILICYIPNSILTRRQAFFGGIYKYLCILAGLLCAFFSCSVGVMKIFEYHSRVLYIVL